MLKLNPDISQPESALKGTTIRSRHGLVSYVDGLFALTVTLLAPSSDIPECPHKVEATEASDNDCRNESHLKRLQYVNALMAP